MWGTRLGYKELEAEVVTSSQTEKNIKDTVFYQEEMGKIQSYSYVIDLTVVFQDKPILR